MRAGLDPNLVSSSEMSLWLARRSSSTPAQKALSVSWATGTTFQFVRLSWPLMFHFFFFFIPSLVKMSTT